MRKGIDTIIFRNFISGKTKNMRAEEQLKLAYMTIAELKDQNAKLVDAIAALERRLAESDGRDRRMVEEFYWQGQRGKTLR